MTSKRWTLNKVEIKAVLRNALIFLSPVAITELTLLQSGQKDWHMYLVAFEVWAIGVGLDTFRKLNAGK